MLLNEDELKLIDNYLDESLPVGEKALFDLKMNDRHFSDEVELRRSVVTGIRDLNRSKLKAELREHLSLVKIKEKRRSKNVRFLSIAASIIVVIVSSWFLLQTQERDTPNELFAAYYKPYPVADATRGEHDSVIPAFEKYQENQYEEAIVLLEKIISHEGADDPFRQLIIGNCYLNTNRFEKAIVAFQNVIESNELVLKQHATWYLALTLLKANRIDESLTILEQIQSDGSLYSGNAESLSTRLEAHQ